MLQQSDPDVARALLEQAEKFVERRFRQYKQLSAT
jgi:hypothetical protein